MLRKNFYLSLLVLAALLLPELVLAGNVSYTSQQAVLLTTNSITLYIGSGSAFNSMSVTGDTITVTVANGDTFVLKDTSSNRRMFLVNSSLTGDCSVSSQSSITLTPGSTTTYTIQPSLDSTCSNTSTGSGGGSTGGGGGSPSPAPSPAPSPSPSPTPAPTPAPSPTPTPAPAPSPTPNPAPAGSHPDGTLVNDNGTIYLVVNGKKRGFRNPAEYLSHGYNFSQAVPATAGDKSLASDAAPIAKALDGTLALDHGTIYMIANGQKRGFTSAKVFKALGYKFEQAKTIDLADYPSADPITTSAAPHPDGALVVGKKGTVWWIVNGQRQGFESAAVFYTYGFSFKTVVAINDADIALPEGPRVKFRDGTLVKDGEVYFLISDGMKRRFASTDVLTSLGYKASNAISAVLANYTESQTLQ